MTLTTRREQEVARLHRLRRNSGLRRLVRETRLDPANLILPLFITAEKEPRAIESLPGHQRWPVAQAVRAATSAAEVGLGGVLLFGIPDEKDESGFGAADPLGPVPLAARAIRAALPDLVLIADVCLCSYATHGHCGVPRNDGTIDNDASLPLLASAALTYAAAGVDIVAPSDMMDGRVAAIRRELNEQGHSETAILSYAAKFASAFYGPFREAADCAPQSGDRAAYQLDPANARDAMREMAADVAEGADALMVKPAGPYLDIIRQARERFELPLAGYQVSGEYAALHAAARLGWLDLRRAALEALTGIKRAGADTIITYFALDAAKWINEDRA